MLSLCKDNCLHYIKVLQSYITACLYGLQLHDRLKQIKSVYLKDNMYYHQRENFTREMGMSFQKKSAEYTEGIVV